MLLQSRGQPVNGHVCGIGPRQELQQAVQHGELITGAPGGGRLPLGHAQPEGGPHVYLPGLGWRGRGAHGGTPHHDLNPCGLRGGLDRFLRPEVRERRPGAAAGQHVDPQEGGQHGIGRQEVEQGQGGGGEGHGLAAAINKGVCVGRDSLFCFFAC